MSLEDDVRELQQNLSMQVDNSQKLLNVVHTQAITITALVANMQAMSAINHGVMAALHDNPAFVAGVKYGAEHRDALFNASVMSDENIKAFKTDLRNLLHANLKHLAD